MNHRKRCFQFEHQVQGLGCTKGTLTFNCIPTVPVWTVATGLPEEQRCTPALINASMQSKPDTHHRALFRKSTNYWNPADTTGLNFSCFKSPAGCMGLGDWKHSSNQPQTLQLEYPHTNEVITSFPPSSPCTGQGERLLLCT